MFAGMMKGPAVAILLAGLVCGVASHPDHTAEPETTPAANVAAASTRVTTSFYSFVTTQIPRDERSIGMGLQREGTDEYYWLYCIDNPFTTKSGFAGCGTDDLYTACSGRVATGIDGGEILCDHQCVTHKVFADLDVTTFTPLIGCGKGTSTMNLVRTSTGTRSPSTNEASATAVDSASGASSATESASTTDSSGNTLRISFPYVVGVGLVAAVQLLQSV